MTLATQPCPGCGGAIHPIAGRCKHCKIDLAAWREAQVRERARPAPVAATPPAPAPQPDNAQTIPDAAPTIPDAAQTLVDAPAFVDDAPSAPTSYVGYAGYAQPSSSWSRRWPVAVAAIAVLAIGLSIGMLAQRWNDDSTETPAPEKARGPSTPMLIPDDMPNHKGPTTKLFPSVPRSFGKKAPKFNGKAPDVGMFAVVFGDTICTKLSSCGLLDDFSEMLCRELTTQLRDNDAAGKVRRGECSYNRAAATACLKAIDGLSCQARTSSDVMDWIAKASSLTECTNTYVCK